MLPILITVLSTTVTYGVRGVLIGGTAAIGYGMGRTYGRIACEYLDGLEVKVEDSWNACKPKDME